MKALRTATNLSVLALASVVLDACGNAFDSPLSTSALGLGPWRTASSARALLYLSNAANNTVTVYRYGAGDASYAFTLTGLSKPEGECVDSKGDVFVTNAGDSKVYEYAHGARSRSAVLNDRFGYPQGCAVDRVSGNLAVANLTGPNDSPGNVAIYKHAAGNPREYFVADLDTVAFCDYGGDGSLYVDGFNRFQVHALLDVLPPSGKAFESVVISGATVFSPGAVQWSGTTLLIGDSNFKFNYQSGVYELRVKGEQGTVVGSVLLRGSGTALQSWKVGDRLIAPQLGQNKVPVYRYPGGTVTTRIAQKTAGPFGAVVSE